ncbi:MAG: adenylate/guanylate cyclase domain-containing protein, partial [Paracoccaceae bacterium]
QGAVQDTDLRETMSQVAERLVDGGMPICRIVLGRTLLPPVIGLIDLEWNSDTGQVTEVRVPRNRFKIEMFDNTPFGDMIFNRVEAYSANLLDTDILKKYDLFEKLADQGVTGYAAFSRTFGRGRSVLPGAPEHVEGAVISFCTRRFSGFSKADVEALERLIMPLCACVRVATDRLLVTELMEIYLGRISGKHVLTGQSARGDARSIDCALLYSDMRNPLELSQAMPPGDFMNSVNQYFDCTAGAVLDHGGEVLKFIGDGVLAIFPFDDANRPRVNMCAAALSASREAFARADHTNNQRCSTGLPPIDFGIALHIGSVLYGNVGTEKRLDFTATGPVVGLVSRCEALTRTLGKPLVATADFRAHCPQDSQSLGTHALRGFGDSVDLFTYPP